MKKLRVIYEPVKCAPEISQQRIDEAFDILFEEVFQTMQLEQQQKNKPKGGDEPYGRLAEGRKKSYLGLRDGQRVNGSLPI